MMRRLGLALLMSVSVWGQTSHTTVRHHREQVTDPADENLQQAQTAIEKQDYAAAKDLLDRYTAANPKDYRGWYTLGYTDSALKQESAAIAAYKQALTLKPDLFEANFNLGVLLAKSGQRDAAMPYLQAATKQKPSVGDERQANQAKARAWLALGTLQSGEDAHRSLQQASALDPANPDVQSALQQSRSAAANAPTQAATSPSAQAHEFIEARQYAKAEPLLQQVVASNPNDATAHYRYGVVLEHLLRNEQAEAELLKAVQLDPKLADAYGDLAIVAADNKHYPLSMRALDARAQYLPENSGTYFLRATNLDHMQQVKPAAVMYRKYLAVAKGESPDNEWRAKHRLIALDPHNETKGKEQ